MASIAAEPGHKGILRDETIMLRWIFGYSHNAKLLDGVSWPDIPQTSVPRGFLSDIKDLGFLSIDVDHFRVENNEIQRVEVGVSFLKAQSLQLLHSKSTQGGNLASRLIKSHHWVFGHKKAFHGRSHHFLFGNAKLIRIMDLGMEFERLTRKPYVLVVHGGKQEFSLLTLLNIKLEPVFILDTVKAAQFPLQLWYRYSLKQLLEEFDIPYSHLHIAGNDAHLTLRVLLMIAVRDAEIQLSGKRLPDWIPIFKAVAQSSLPPRPPTKRELAAMAEAEADRQTAIKGGEP
ncbi:QDE-2-interacting protein [Fusarium pseudocircinatum]|uniref:QDE-2-interacting protein n=1 Tax=Fusarium pseudocircinatum TaxID=56676 RepID=A0A8H5L6T0_9HYPO|nr:QDE-2-interacting protein [Fusarium pseudocircinatum]